MTKVFQKKFILLHAIYLVCNYILCRKTLLGVYFNFLMVLFSHFNWKLMGLLIPIKNEFKSYVLTQQWFIPRTNHLGLEAK